MKNYTIFTTRLLIPVMILLVMTAMSTTAWAQSLLDENFSYSPGQLTNLSGGANVSGGNWVNFSGTGSPIQVSSGSLSYVRIVPLIVSITAPTGGT